MSESRWCVSGWAKWVVIVGGSIVAVLLVAGGVVGVFAVTAQKSVSGYESTYAPPAPMFPRASDFGRQLAVNSEPKTITVLGDSTGNEQSEWVYLLAHIISDVYMRPVTVHDWSVPDTAYVGEKTVGSGPNAPVVIWNGSASGADAGYLSRNFKVLAPSVSDLVMLNFGHNQTAPAAAVQGGKNLLALLRSVQPATRPIVTLTLQNPRLDASASNQAAKVEALRGTFADRADVQVIDVWVAFVDASDLASLLREDGFNPNDAGQMIWAGMAAEALGLSRK